MYVKGVLMKHIWNGIDLRMWWRAQHMFPEQIWKSQLLRLDSPSDSIPVFLLENKDAL